MPPPTQRDEVSTGLALQRDLTEILAGASGWDLAHLLNALRSIAICPRIGTALKPERLELEGEPSSACKTNPPRFA